MIADSGRTGVTTICQIRPRVGALFSHVLATRVFATSGPTPSYFLLNVRIFNAAPSAACMFRSSFGKLGTNVTSKTAIVKLTAAGSHRSVTPLYRCMLSSFRKFACSGLARLCGWSRGKLPLHQGLG